MAINYNTDIVTGLYATDVASDANFQAPGNFGLPTGFGSRTLTGGVIAVAGTGYTVGQLLTLSGGSHSVVATLTVLTVGGSGQVLTFEVNNPGVYTALPTNPVGVTSGSFTFTATWGGLASQRLLSFVALITSYLSECDNVHEAKLLHQIMGRVMAEMRFGTPTWNGSTMATDALNAAMHYLAKAQLPSAGAL